VFGDEMVRDRRARPDVVAITAAMLHPTGLAQFAAAYPTGSTTWASPSSTR
jgi:1-deoxy-D-xylulose-5-phosphate synthase